MRGAGRRKAPITAEWGTPPFYPFQDWPLCTSGDAPGLCPLPGVHSLEMLLAILLLSRCPADGHSGASCPPWPVPPSSLRQGNRRGPGGLSSEAEPPPPEQGSGLNPTRASSSSATAKSLPHSRWAMWSPSTRATPAPPRPRLPAYLAVPMFRYWHSNRCRKVFLKVALQSA